LMGSSWVMMPTKSNPCKNPSNPPASAASVKRREDSVLLDLQTLRRTARNNAGKITLQKCLPTFDMELTETFH
jgi:hypothetical protein